MTKAERRSTSAEGNGAVRTALVGVCALLALGLFNVAQARSHPPGALGVTRADVPAATTGQVVVFQLEFTPLAAFDDLEQCNNAPLLAHTLVNLSDGGVTLFADDRCLVPLLTVKRGFGSHVLPGQSFAARAS